MTTANPQPLPDNLITPADVASRLGVGRRTVYGWIERNVIAPKHVVTITLGSRQRIGLHPTVVEALRQDAYRPPLALTETRR